ncbi:hypothetical protein MLD38_013875 [Melastoma candidum]|uniref:Uncharacterized protein n=1 Tax=Melastoma candidum TaxID=119954 RepID=A0ACB9RAD2_9MYRT|nr:hypothetical protein MLD38_013875 [Melastoma candidum]
MQEMGSREEKILVLVRLRPLNEKEIAVNELADWECINDTTILYRNGLREGSTFPSAYSFDRVFRGDNTTRQLYEEGIREIALSVVNGINSTVFAYGQTSSGKTYTMCGITDYAVADIFDYIYKHEERAFALKLSAIEIYNEVVRDLLSTDNVPLRLLDDPERGTIVEKLREETVRDHSHFNQLVAICEAQRQVGETSLNEKSSRSHQILRLTVESSAREFMGKDSSTALSASVNFVDLAGSERASQALSAGARLKEGCHINRSLLTLGNVIRKLSKGRNGHINYRDSKLTRILQPALGGNARTAIICTLSPARSHVEQTRNTLLFACCAKEVMTKAQVNVVMSDKALVKHLQKELARLESELRTPGPPTSNNDHTGLLKKKDLQIEKMEREIRELTKQRDQAHYRIEELLQLIDNDRDSQKMNGIGNDREWRRQSTWEDNGSMSELSGVTNGSYYEETKKRSTFEQPSHVLWQNEHFMTEAISSPPSIGHKYFRAETSVEEITTGEASDEYCKDVRCVDTEVSSRGNDSGVLASSPDECLSQAVDGDTIEPDSASGPVLDDQEENDVETFSHYGALEQRLNHVQKTIDSLVPPDVDDMSPEDLGECAGDKIEATASELRRSFTGQPEGVKKNSPLLSYDVGTVQLSRNSSQSSLESTSIARSVGAMPDEDVDIPSINAFVSGLKEMADAYENQLSGDQGKEPIPGSNEKNGKGASSDPIQEALASASDWPQEFERRQRRIIELWHSCNVPLVHRTYFFLMFRGDPMDSVYMEVELRRLTFLDETFSLGGHTFADGRVVTWSSSLKSLQREREKLSKLMRRRLSEEERLRLFKRWGIAKNSKRRRLQLANHLWRDTKDMNHVMDSASIVGKLVGFTEQGQSLKSMLGLNFNSTKPRGSSSLWRQRSSIPIG